MSAKAFFVVCAQALLIQSALSQCPNRASLDASAYPASLNWPGYGFNGLAGPAVYDAPACAGRNLAPIVEITPTSGGGLQVTSTSAIPPTGISVVSENVFEGALSVAGELPFVGTTDMEGVLPSTGAGAINHGCGNGVTAITSDSVAYAPAAAAIAPAAAAIAPAAAAIAPAAAAIAPAAAAIAPAAAAIAPAAAAIAPAAAAIAPAAAAIAPAAASPASPFGLGAGFSPANRFGGNLGCGGRGLYY